MAAKSGITVSIGDGAVSIKRSGRTSVIVAKILGMDLDSTGKPETIWLDRLVHSPEESEFEGWSVEGAITSILRRKET